MSAHAHAPVRRALHWAVAAVVLTAIPLGLVFTDFDNKPWIEATFGAGAFDAYYNLHKSLGLTALALMIARVWARRRWPDPAYAQPLPPLQATLSRAAHLSLYALLIVVPLLGWLGVSAYPAPVPVFGLFDAPMPVAPNRGLAERALEFHGALATMASFIILAHIAAALQHRFIRRDGVFARMWPGAR